MQVFYIFRETLVQSVILLLCRFLSYIPMPLYPTTSNLISHSSSVSSCLTNGTLYPALQPSSCLFPCYQHHSLLHILKNQISLLFPLYFSPLVECSNYFLVPLQVHSLSSWIRCIAQVFLLLSTASATENIAETIITLTWHKKITYSYLLTG